MIFQLPTGKIVYLTIDQFLDMTDEDEQELIANNAGSNAPDCSKPCYHTLSEQDKVFLKMEEFTLIAVDDESLERTLSVEDFILYSDLMDFYDELDPEEPLEE